MPGLNLRPEQAEKARRRPAPPTSQVPSHGLELSERCPACCPWRFERAVEAVTDVIVNQSLLGVLDRALDRLQLLSKLQTRPALLDHLDDGAKMAIGTLETLDDRGMTVMWHLLFPSRGEDNADPPQGSDDVTLVQRR
jgi:hypothetical protein